MFCSFCSANNVMWSRVLFCSSVLFCDYSRVVGPVGLPGVRPGFLVSVPCTRRKTTTQNAGAAGGVAPAQDRRHPAGGITPTGESRHLRRFCADAT